MNVEPRMLFYTARRSRGFTLLEVLVALAVFAIAAASLISALTESVRSEQYLEQRTLAHWVGLNQLSVTRLLPVWPEVGISDGITEMTGMEWHWRRKVEGTADPKMRRVDIEIRLDEEELALATISGFITQEAAALNTPRASDTSGGDGTFTPDDYIESNNEEDGGGDTELHQTDPPANPND